MLVLQARESHNFLLHTSLCSHVASGIRNNGGDGANGEVGKDGDGGDVVDDDDAWCVPG